MIYMGRIREVVQTVDLLKPQSNITPAISGSQEWTVEFDNLYLYKYRFRIRPTPNQDLNPKQCQST